MDVNFNIGKDCRSDIGEHARVQLGSGHLNPNTRLVILHGLRINQGCAMSWDCQFLDEDFHTLSQVDRPAASRDARIEVGDRVWIGSQVTVLKGPACRTVRWSGLARWCAPASPKKTP